MKKITIAFLLLIGITGTGYAQTITDTHANATIFAIDYQSGQEVQAYSDAAVLFKDAFIDLAANTTIARSIIKAAPGHKSYVVTQVDPNSGYGFQLVFQSVFLGQTITIYTFLYNADQNALYFFDKQMQDWAPVTVSGVNAVALNNLKQLAEFNDPNYNQQAPQENAQVNDDEDTTPVDTAVSANVAPPALPEYDQPECPQDGYLWQPGYWAYSPMRGAYYWVPGAWVAPPDAGLLWTPPYWGFVGGVYVFHNGYWGNRVGFYGGINYGYGYAGVGFVGGEWHENRFRYNTAVVRVNTTVIHNTYVNNTVVVVNNNHTSFNGRGGIMARPTPGEAIAMHERHVAATPEQIRNQRIARDDHNQFANANGRPANLATAKVPPHNPNPNPAANRTPANGATGNRGNFGFGNRPAGNDANGNRNTNGAATTPANNTNGNFNSRNNTPASTGATNAPANNSNYNRNNAPAGNNAATPNTGNGFNNNRGNTNTPAAGTTPNVNQTNANSRLGNSTPAPNVGKPVMPGSAGGRNNAQGSRFGFGQRNTNPKPSPNNNKTEKNPKPDKH